MWRYNLGSVNTRCVTLGSHFWGIGDHTAYTRRLLAHVGAGWDNHIKRAALSYNFCSCEQRFAEEQEQFFGSLKYPDIQEAVQSLKQSLFWLTKISRYSRSSAISETKSLFSIFFVNFRVVPSYWLMIIIQVGCHVVHECFIIWRVT